MTMWAEFLAGLFIGFVGMSIVLTIIRERR